MKRVLTLLLLTLVLGLSVSPAVAEEVFSLSEADVYKRQAPGSW